jgi:hypothetical protein
LVWIHGHASPPPIRRSSQVLLLMIVSGSYWVAAWPPGDALEIQRSTFVRLVLRRCGTATAIGPLWRRRGGDGVKFAKAVHNFLIARKAVSVASVVSGVVRSHNWENPTKYSTTSPREIVAKAGRRANALMVCAPGIESALRLAEANTAAGITSACNRCLASCILAWISTENSSPKFRRDGRL